MIPSLAMHAPWAIRPDRLAESLAALAAARPPRKPMYQETEGGFDMAEDWSLAEQHNSARLMIQRVGNGTAVIQVRGVIMKNCPFWLWLAGYGTSLRLLDAALDMVADGGYSALVLDFSSPGGQCQGMVETVDRIKELAQRGIRTTAYSETEMCSLAYFIGSGCQEIYVAPTAIVGSIGTVAKFTDISKALEMAGLREKVFVAREAPLKANENGSLTQAQEDEIQRHVNEADSLFQAQVKSSRRRMNLAEASTGAWWYGASAPKGMVDDAKLFHSLNDLLSVVAS